MKLDRIVGAFQQTPRTNERRSPRAKGTASRGGARKLVKRSSGHLVLLAPTRSPATRSLSPESANREQSRGDVSSYL